MRLPVQIGQSKLLMFEHARIVSVRRQSVPPVLKRGESVKGTSSQIITLLSTADELSTDVIV